MRCWTVLSAQHRLDAARFHGTKKEIVPQLAITAPAGGTASGWLALCTAAPDGRS